LRVLAVDCDPNPNLAESFGLSSAELPRFAHEGGLTPADGSLRLVREPRLVEAKPGVWVLGGPPNEMALADAVARGIAGVLLAGRFDFVLTDLGAGPAMARTAVGGVLNPADLCVVLSDGRRQSELAAARIEDACRERRVEAMRLLNRRDEPEAVASELAGRLREQAGAGRRAGSA
jgi:cellulose biosynthesis protein BcsQ